MEHGIYHRQTLLAGWEQERLIRASVAIFGSDYLAGWCALYLACLGVGRIYILDATVTTPAVPCFLQGTAGQPRAQGWANWLIRLGLPTRILVRRIHAATSPELLPPADVFLSVTNDPAIQMSVAAHATRHGIPLILGAAQEQGGAYRVIGCDTETDNFLPMVSGARKQGALPGLIVAALIAEETRRFLLPLPEDCPLPAGITHSFDPAHHARFCCTTTSASVSNAEDAAIPSPTPPHRILLVGAGALGTFAGLGLALQAGITDIAIVDPDYIETTNGNRQPFYLNRDGEGKSITLANSLRRINGDIRWSHFAAEIGAIHFDLARPDLVLCCTDSFVSRHQVHQECLQRRIPFLSGGTSAFSGNLAAYVPGKTACLNCALGLADLATREAQEQADPAHCQKAPEPSIVTTNALIGSLMALEAGRERNPLPSTLLYQAQSPCRFSLRLRHKPCRCHHIANQESEDVK